MKIEDLVDYPGGFTANRIGDVEFDGIGGVRRAEAFFPENPNVVNPAPAVDDLSGSQVDAEILAPYV